jgi:phosphonate transport system substrate-binding protein
MLRHVALAAVLLWYAAGTTAIGAEPVYTFGVVPQTGGSRIAREWTPILKFLEAKTGLTFRFATARDIPTFSRRVAVAKYDFGYLNPTDYVQYADDAGYRAIGRARNVKLKGVIVVRKDSTIEQLADLAEKELAVPANAFAANAIPRAVLDDMGITVTARPVAGHDTVYRSVATGRHAAGGGVMRTFTNTAGEYREQLRVLWTSEGYSPHAFVAHTRVPAEVVKVVQEALIDMHLDPVGRVLLNNVAPEGVDYARDQDWDDIRELDI